MHKWSFAQYVKVYTEVMFEIRHMHELDQNKFNENWHASLSEAIMKVEGFSDVGGSEEFRFKKENKFLHKKAHHEREWNWGQDISKGEKLKRCSHIIKTLTHLLGVLLNDYLF